MVKTIVHLLCSIWVVSLAGTIEHELLGLHTYQDTRRAVLADCDVDCNTMSPVQFMPFYNSESEPQTDVLSVPGRRVGNENAVAQSRLNPGGQPLRLNSETTSKTVLRL